MLLSVLILLFYSLLDKYKVREKIDRVFVQPERIIIAPKIYKGSEDGR